MRNWRHLLGTSPVRVEPQAVMLKYFAVSADSAPLGEQSLHRTAFLSASIEGLGRNFAPYPPLDGLHCRANPTFSPAKESVPAHGTCSLPR